MPSNIDYDYRWIFDLISKAALRGDVNVVVKFTWKKWELIPSIGMSELGYNVGLDHPLEPTKIIFSGW